MAIKVHNKMTGDVWLRNYDQAVLDALGAVPDPSDPENPCFSVNIAGASNVKVPVFFNQPEQIYKTKRMPAITINRDDATPAMQRWMGVGQLEYRAGVSGTGIMIGGVSGYTQYVSKPQAMPYDFTYAITCFDRYEANVQTILKQVLKSFPPIGKLFVKDSLDLLRSYEARSEGSLVPTKETIDAVTRFVSYTVMVRVDGEIDLSTPVYTGGVTGFDYYAKVFR